MYGFGFSISQLQIHEFQQTDQISVKGLLVGLKANPWLIALT